MVWRAHRIGLPAGGRRTVRQVTADGEKRVGPWICGEQLGRGGNGAVFRARRDADADEVALKLVNATKAHSEPYRRFAREIEFLRSIGDFRGVLPVVDAYVPESPSPADRPWLAMPIATPIASALADATLETVVRAVGAFADTLARLGEEHQIGHRDVKPGNLYELDGEFLVGDFGLIDVPDLEELTRSGRPLGPANFTAYEVIRNPATADSGPADVYSLGKTLWVLATAINWPPNGHQPADSRGHTVADHRPHAHATPLDALIDRMTRLDADDRPAMRQVATDLGAWLELSAQPVTLNVSEVRARIRDALGAEIAAQDLQEERKHLAREAVRALQERTRSLNEALRDVHPRAEIDGRDKLTENVLTGRGGWQGAATVFSWVRCSSIATGEISPYALRMGRSVELTEDSRLRAGWMLTVGNVKTSGSDFDETRNDYAAPVGSIEQERMLERFIVELGARLQAALAVFAENAPGRGR